MPVSRFGFEGGFSAWHFMLRDKCVLRKSSAEGHQVQ